MFSWAMRFDNSSFKFPKGEAAATKSCMGSNLALVKKISLLKSASKDSCINVNSVFNAAGGMSDWRRGGAME